MGKSKSKNSRKYRIVYVILSGLSFVLFSIGGLCFYDTNIIKANNLELENNYQNLNKEYNTVKVNNEVSASKIEHLNNIETELENIKKIVFSNASKLEQKIKNNSANVKIAYITFDDGPYYTTYKFLDILDKYKIKATFFNIGSGKTHCYDNYSYDCTKLYKEITTRGHTMANHTYSHKIWNGIYLSTDAFMEQIIKQENLIKDKTGVITKITRFPGGSSTAGSLKKNIISALRQRGYGWVDWTAQDGDGGSVASTSAAWNNFTSSINENIEVVLFHDYSTITLSILPKAIEYLQNKNYIILPLFYESVMINK